jgi:hypothetical protein
MIRRSTVILLVIFLIVLGATIYLSRTPQGITRFGITPTATSQPKLLVNWTAGTLNKIEVQNPGAAPVVVQRTKDTWGFLTLEARTVDQGKLLQLLSSLPTVNVLGKLDPPPPVAASGLGSSAVVLKMTHTDGSIVTIRFGNKTPTTNGYYVQVGDQTPIICDQTAVQDILTLLSPDGLIIQTPTPAVPIPQNGTPTP